MRYLNVTFFFPRRLNVQVLFSKTFDIFFLILFLQQNQTNSYSHCSNAKTKIKVPKSPWMEAYKLLDISA